MVENHVSSISEDHLRTLKIKAQECFNLELTQVHLAQFFLYAQLLLDWNERMNLTSIIDPEEIVIKHFLDSLIFVKWLNYYYPTGKIFLADLGTGAGFPGIPIKILLPKVKVVLIDALRKRINFLNEVNTKLQLQNIDTYHARAEDFGRNNNYRETFDVTVARAVAELPVLLEYSSPLLKVGGRFLAAKGVDPENEVRLTKNAMQVLNCSLEQLEKYSLAEGADYRSFIIIKKTKSTPSLYPRPAGKPKKNPL